ncbi:MAG: hypothetical protein K8S15_03080 [Candidatus Aegiribacteria sp.]|nr:hypothetical protein [Candidatus Aegiribacteria sp.]
MKIYVTAGIVAIAVAGCGASDNSTTTASMIQIDTNPTVTLVPVDSIGMEMGDSNYVMGGVEGAAFGPDGSIAVLDCGRSAVRLYSPEGVYLRSIGRRGNGPGELQNVTFMAISDSGHIHLSGTGSDMPGAHSYDYYTGEWLGSCGTFIPPSCLEGARGNSYLRKDISFEVDGDDIVLPITISMYEAGTDEPLVTYFEEIVPFDMTDDVGMLELDWYGYDIAVGSEGMVLIAPRSTEEALIVACDSAGNEIRTLELPYQPARRTEEEMEMERNILRAKAIASNESPVGLEPDPFKPMIRGLETDGEGNLWVLQGGPSIPTFTVLSPSGEFLFTARVAGEPQDGSTWRFHIDENGFLAYAEDPFSGFQKIYILQMQGG